MAEPKAIVRNASSPEQVKKGQVTEKQQRDQDIRDLQAVLESPAGRRVLSRFIAMCRVNESIFDGNGSKMSFNSGQQTLGQSYIREIITAQPNAWILMQQEALQLEATKTEPPVRAEDDES